MRFAFGNVVSLGAFAGFDIAESFVDPNKPDPRARSEMDVFDNLSAEQRDAIRNSRFGVALASTYATIVRGGSPPHVRDALKARGLMPCDVGTEGVLVELVRIEEERESARMGGTNYAPPPDRKERK